MKISGNKIVYIFSGIVLVLMLIISSLPICFFQFKTDSCTRTIEGINVENIDFIDSSQVFIGFAIGREISLSL